MTSLRMRMSLALAVGVAFASTLAPSPRVLASDHGDTAENVNRIAADLTDLYIFPSPDNADNVVLVMDTYSLAPPGQFVSFDPRVLYQFKIDTTGDFVEDLVIQAKFSGTGPDQRVQIAGPVRPFRTGTISNLMRPNPNVGVINQTFFPRAGMKVFTGLREDPFFLDFERFVAILPDRGTPLGTRPSSVHVNIPNPNEPQLLSWRPPATSMDFFMGVNVLSIVIELPRAALGGDVIRVWMTTSVFAGSNTFRQQDRLARPLVNEVLATVTNRDSESINKQTPREDPRGTLTAEIESFLTFPAGRSRAIKEVIKSVLIPDVMVADLSEPGPASYLGVETNGATGGTFGGRKLTDDVVDITLMIAFGTLISDLGLAPADGNEIPSLTSDNVPPQDNILVDRPFPFLPPPAGF